MHLLTQHVPENLLWLTSWFSLYLFVVWTLIFFWTCIPVTIDHVRRGWVVMAFIIGMIETVPDVLSQLMVALLYELVLVLVSHRWDNNEQQ